jgi:5'-phosphate synthase pdxT subunit
MKIGVLALQGAFIEHIRILQQFGVDAPSIRLPDEFNSLDGLIIPGGGKHHHPEADAEL